MTRQVGRPSWVSMALVAPGSLAFLAATVMWVSGHDPRAADTPIGTSGPTAAASTTKISDTAGSLRLARLQVLLGQAEAQLLLLDQTAGAAVQAPSPGPAGVSPPATAGQPPTATAPAPLAHATTGASGA